jgi:DNA-binding IclR family transcriptional regulator
MAEEQSKTDNTTDEPTEERLEKLEEHIEQARREGEEAAHGSFYEGESAMSAGQKFVDSGEEARRDPSDEGAESKSDDQTIAP